MIKGNIIFSEKAANDVRLIIQWYNRKRDNLGEEFALSLNKILTRVEKNP